MKTIFIALVVLLSSLSAFAQDYKFIVLNYTDENGVDAIVKVRITKKMFNQRIEPGIGISCYSTLNPNYRFRMISGNYFFIGKGNSGDEGTPSVIRTFIGLDNVFAHNSIEVSGGQYSRQMFTMYSAPKYIETQSQPYNAHLPKLEDIAEVASSKLSALVYVNTFACAFIGKTGPIDPPN